MNDSFEKIIDFNFFNYSPFFAQGLVSITPPILERLDAWGKYETYMEAPLSEMNNALPFGDAECTAVKVPKGQAATLKYDGIIGIYTPKLAPALGGIANYTVGRIYPKESHLIIFESKDNELVIEQNLVEDYHHVVFKFGKEIKKSHIVDQQVGAIPKPEDPEKAKKMAALRLELQKLEEES